MKKYFLVLLGCLVGCVSKPVPEDTTNRKPAEASCVKIQMVSGVKILDWDEKTGAFVKKVRGGLAPSSWHHPMVCTFLSDDSSAVLEPRKQLQGGLWTGANGRPIFYDDKARIQISCTEEDRFFGPPLDWKDPVAAMNDSMRYVFQMSNCDKP